MARAEARAAEQQRKIAAGAGARRRAADLHALHLRPARAHRRHRRARQGQADADLRQAAAVRSVRRASWRAAKAVAAVDAGGSGDDLRGALQVLAAGRRPHLPRGFQLRRRREPDRRQSCAAGCRRRGPLRRRSRAPDNHAGAEPARSPSRRSRRATAPAAPRRCPRSPPTRRSRRRPPSRHAEPAAAPARAAQRDPNRPVIAELRRQGDNLRLFFPFAAPTPAAVFQRADTLWLVFDTKAAIDVGVAQQRPEQDHPQRRRGARGRRAGRAPQARTAAAHQRRAAGFRLARHGRRGDGGRDASR